MKELIEKISSYNLFNYLFPGIVFVVLLEYATSYSLILENNFIGAFLYYFVGLVISRFGSLIVEPILRKSSFVKFSNYSDFVKASKKDEKVELLSEVNNMYRTIIAMFSLVLVVGLYDFLQKTFELSSNFTNTLLIIALLLLFIFSYKKQTSYVVKRVSSNLNDNNNV